MRVVKGDIGNELYFNIVDDKGNVNLTGASVSLTITINNGVPITKTATIQDATTGKCYLLLDGDIFTNAGFFIMRATVNFSDGKKFNSLPQQIAIEG